MIDTPHARMPVEELKRLACASIHLIGHIREDLENISSLETVDWTDIGSAIMVLDLLHQARRHSRVLGPARR